jgi:hypothetical protein
LHNTSKTSTSVSGIHLIYRAALIVSLRNLQK